MSKHDIGLVGLRISGDEKDPAGLTEPETLEAITALATDLDYVNVIAGSSASHDSRKFTDDSVFSGAFTRWCTLTVRSGLGNAVEQPDPQEVIVSPPTRCLSPPVST